MKHCAKGLKAGLNSSAEFFRTRKTVIQIMTTLQNKMLYQSSKVGSDDDTTLKVAFLLAGAKVLTPVVESVDTTS
jgi:hypothetical protein